MPFDYSQTADPKDFSQPIPDGTLATVLMRIRPGGVGEGNLLKRTTSGEAEMLDCEFVLVDDGADLARDLGALHLQAMFDKSAEVVGDFFENADEHDVLAPDVLELVQPHQHFAGVQSVGAT